MRFYGAVLLPHGRAVVDEIALTDGRRTINVKCVPLDSCIQTLNAEVYNRMVAIAGMEGDCYVLTRETKGKKDAMEIKTWQK